MTSFSTFLGNKPEENCDGEMTFAAIYIYNWSEAKGQEAVNIRIYMN